MLTPLTAAENGCRQLPNPVSDENQQSIAGWFLQRLQEAVGGVCRHSIRRIDDRNLAATRITGEAQGGNEFAYLLDTDRIFVFGRCDPSQIRMFRDGQRILRRRLQFTNSQAAAGKPGRCTALAGARRAEQHQRMRRPTLFDARTPICRELI